MRKSKILLPELKERILALQGHPVRLVVHNGRKRYNRYTGVLESVYPSVFTVRIDNPTSIDLLSYSFSDVLCGDVKLSARESS